MSRGQALISDSPDLESGIVNTAMTSDLEMSELNPGTTAATTQVIEESEVESFMLNLTARRRRKQRQLSQSTQDPSEKLSKEVRSVKQSSRQALTENAVSSHSPSPAPSAASSRTSCKDPVEGEEEGEGEVPSQQQQQQQQQDSLDYKPVPAVRLKMKKKEKKKKKAAADVKIVAGSKRGTPEVTPGPSWREDSGKLTDSEADHVVKLSEEEEEGEAEEEEGESIEMAMSRSSIRDKIKSLRLKAKDVQEKDLEEKTRDAAEKLRKWSRRKSSSSELPEISEKEAFDFFTETWEHLAECAPPTPGALTPHTTTTTTTTTTDEEEEDHKEGEEDGTKVKDDAHDDDDVDGDHDDGDGDGEEEGEGGEGKKSKKGKGKKKEKKEKKKKKKKKEKEEKEEEEEKKKEKRKVSVKEKESDKSKEEAEEEVDDGYCDDMFPLLPDLSEKESAAFQCLVKPEKVCTELQLKHESQMYFYPSTRPIPPSEKLPGSQIESRNLVDEGFYVGSPPPVTPANRNKMQHRLLIQATDTDKKWFGEDGEILSLPDPLKTFPSRPPLFDDEDPNFGVVFTKAEVHEFDTRLMSGYAHCDQNYQLDIDINSIVFSQHHLFSVEHILAHKLVSYYQQYQKIVANNSISFLTKKLKAVKTSSQHLQEYMMNKELNVADEANYKQRLKDYRSEIRAIRHQKDWEEKCLNSLVKSMVHVWKNIKALRDRQKFVSTPVKLIICKQEVERDVDDQQWREDIEEEVEEIRADFEETYQHQEAEYKLLHDIWQRKHQLRKEALKRQNMKKKKKKKKKKTAEDEVNEEDEEQAQRDEEILSEVCPVKPVCPEAFDERGTRDRVRAKAMECRRHPGTPRILPEISYTAKVTPTSDCPRLEMRRRNEVSSCQVFIRILFNDKQVLQTNSRFLLENFRVNFGQIYHLKIVQWPDTITLQVYESHTLSNWLLAELYLAIPDSSVTTNNITVQRHDFSSDINIQFTHNAVGSGVAVNLDMLTPNKTYINTSGSVLCSVAWAVGDDGLPLAPTPKSGLLQKLQSMYQKSDPVSAIGASGIMDLQRLAEWVRTARLDPNDPSNADLMFLLRPHLEKGPEGAETDFFRLEPFQEEFNFATDDDIKQNRRFILLRLRHREVREFCNYLMVPALEREIPKSVFKEYNLRKQEEEKLLYQDSIDTQRSLVGRYKDKLYEEMLSRFRAAYHRKTLEDVVVEDGSPYIHMIGQRILQFLQPRRPLKPVRTERKRVSQGVKGEEIYILANVIQAFNIPVRRQPEATASLDVTEVSSLTNNTESVRPFIEVSFQNYTVRTQCAVGPNPSFNEEIMIPF
ncbi:hypothetical protein Ahia01_001410400, partial [Argonauta hians]